MKLADALAETLRDWDVRYMFGVSGANIEHLHDAIHRLEGGGLESVLAKSEVGAAFMADCRARTHRTLGVCSATSGGGMMNLAVGVAESYAESVPVLALIGQPPMTLEGRGAFQDSSGIGRTVDAEALFGSIAKYVRKVDSAEIFWESLREAVDAALSGRPGPAVLLLPRDVFGLEVGARPAGLPTSLADFVWSSAPDVQEVSALFEALRSARRPVLLVGTGAERSQSSAAVRAFAEEAQIAVATTMASPNAFPHDHPLFLGTVGAVGNPSTHDYLNESADLIVTVGTGLNVMVRQPIAPALQRCRFAAVNIDPGALCRVVPDSLAVRGDAGEVFGQLLERLREEPFVHAGLEAHALTRYKPVLAPSASETSEDSAGMLLQSEAVEVLERHLPERGHLLFDAGNCAVAALHGMSLPSGLTGTIALGMGGMGYAIAGSIGAQLGETRGRTVVVCGDGAFLMLGLEVHTAIEKQLPILFVVFNNSSHGMCVSRQQLMFEGRIECSRYSGFDAAAVARGLGRHEAVWSARVSTRDELVDALREFDAHHAAGPGVLELVLRREELPPFGPFVSADAETVAVRTLGAASSVAA
jgi:acetolactate synthase-1/2/3 large subunit